MFNVRLIIQKKKTCSECFEERKKSFFEEKKCIGEMKKRKRADQTSQLSKLNEKQIILHPKGLALSQEILYMLESIDSFIKNVKETEIKEETSKNLKHRTERNNNESAAKTELAGIDYNVDDEKSVDEKEFLVQVKELSTLEIVQLIAHNSEKWIQDADDPDQKSRAMFFLPLIGETATLLNHVFEKNENKNMSFVDAADSLEIPEEHAKFCQDFVSLIKKLRGVGELGK